MITTVIFDLGEVLLNAIRDSGRKLGLDYAIDCSSAPGAENFSAYGTLHPLFVPAIRDYVHGSISEDEYFAAVRAAYPALEALDLKAYVREHFTEIAGTREIILKLKKLGYRLGLLSVHAKDWIEYCEEKFHFLALFDAASFSYEAGVSKPDPKAYQVILDKLGAAPEQCLFIDDTPANVSAAEALGLSGIVFSSAAELDISLKLQLPDYDV